MNRTREILATIVLLCLTIAGSSAQEIKELSLTTRNHEAGTLFDFTYHLTPGAKFTEAAVYVMLEGRMNETQAALFDRMATEGIIPEGIFIRIVPGWLGATTEGGISRCMRAEEFDTNGSDFTNAIVEEIIPYAAMDAGITLSTDPDKHLIAGGSSGGYLAWVAAWHRNDYFHRVFLSSPTFSNIRGGHEDLFMIRKTEPKPIRIYMTSGTTEPDYYFGDSFYAACNAYSAFKFVGYEMKHTIFSQKGHCHNYQDMDTWEDMLTWQFQQEKVVVPKGSTPYRRQVPEGSYWEECTAIVPAKCTKLSIGKSMYYIRNGHLIYKQHGKKMPVEGIGKAAAICFSSDLWRLYVADAESRYVYAYTLDSAGVPGARYKLAPIELNYDIKAVGCQDICISDEDRVFVATEMGVQSMRSFGINDIILPLPNNQPVLRVWLAEGYLYATSTDKTYRRAILSKPHDGKSVCQPSSRRYDDGFNYSRPHLEEYLDKDIVL